MVSGFADVPTAPPPAAGRARTGQPGVTSARRVFDTVRVEPVRVTPSNFPPDDSVVGAWVTPYGETFNRWEITALHARYVAPPEYRTHVDGWGQQQQATVRFEMLAYHVDLDSDDALPTLTGAFLYQMPPVRWWWLKLADEKSLKRYEQYRVS